jgi:hypothetical protein
MNYKHCTAASERQKVNDVFPGALLGLHDDTAITEDITLEHKYALQDLREDWWL